MPNADHSLPPTESLIGAARIETISIRRVHVFADRDADGEFFAEEWASEVPAKFAGHPPVAELWRMVGYFNAVGDDGESDGQAMFEIADAPGKRRLVELYCRLTGLAVPTAVLQDVDTHNLPAYSEKV